MAVEDNYTYYGLFPKLNFKKQTPKMLGMSFEDFTVLKEIDNYWKAIDED